MKVTDLFVLRWAIGSTPFDLEDGDSNFFTLGSFSLHRNMDILKSETMEDAGSQFARKGKYLLFTGCNLELPLSEFCIKRNFEVHKNNVKRCFN